MKLAELQKGDAVKLNDLWDSGIDYIQCYKHGTSNDGLCVSHIVLKNGRNIPLDGSCGGASVSKNTYVDMCCDTCLWHKDGEKCKRGTYTSVRMSRNGNDCYSWCGDTEEGRAFKIYVTDKEKL